MINRSISLKVLLISYPISWLSKTQSWSRNDVQNAMSLKDFHHALTSRSVWHSILSADFTELCYDVLLQLWKLFLVLVEASQGAGFKFALQKIK